MNVARAELTVLVHQDWSWSSLKHPAGIQTLLGHVCNDLFTAQRGVHLLNAISTGWWLNRCNCFRARSIEPSIAKPRGPPSVGHGNCCFFSKTDTNQQRQRVRGDLALPRLGKTLFSVIFAIICFSWISLGVRRADCGQLFYKSSVPQTQLCSRSHWLIPSLDINGCEANVTNVDMELHFPS